MTLVAAAGGVSITYLYEITAGLTSRLCSGACIGLGILGLSGLGAWAALGPAPAALILAAAAAAAPLLLMIDRERRTTATRELQDSLSGIKKGSRLRASARTLCYLAIALMLYTIFNRVLMYRPDGMYTGILNNYGDLPFHLNVITRFVYGGNVPPENPIFAGARFSYPFMADFVAAMFVRAGASLGHALQVMNLTLAFALAGLMYGWSMRLTRGDRRASAIALMLVLFSGGLGFLLLLGEGLNSGQGLLALLRHPPHDYTIAPSEHISWGNALTSLLIPQRSILFGMPLAIIIFTQWWEVLDGPVDGGGGERSGANRRMLATGILAGFLPLIHAHSFGAVVGTGLCLACLSPKIRQSVLLFLVPALTLAAPQVIWVIHGSAARPGAFFGWHFGWNGGGSEFLLFWLKNAGVFIPCLLAAILWRGEQPLVPRRLLLYYAPFALWFVVPNMVSLAPWIWDNIKVMIYWYIGSSVLVGLLISRLWAARGAKRCIAAILFAWLTLAGAVDVWRVVSGTTEYRVFDNQQIAFARLIMRTTKPNALILHAPIQNSPVVLTGRRSLIGHPSQVWSHGINPDPRAEEVKRIYAGGTDAAALLRRYAIDYIEVSPFERTGMPFNQKFFDQFPVAGQADEYTLYQVPASFHPAIHQVEQP
ncbi:MAG TPA: hypothetical protein VJX67_01180 [Blastocatellia bacterium]|nr:hypothetical protein [Blastocatellia bacterium]